MLTNTYSFNLKWLRFIFTKGTVSFLGFASYVLKKRFGRGSYGEVWLAFHWNCYQGSNSSHWGGSNNNVSFYSIPFDSEIRNSSSFTHKCHSGSLDDNLFILKRIMVIVLANQNCNLELEVP